MRRLLLSVGLLAIAASACAPPSSGQRLADAAYEMNYATRFGRMDLAIEYVKASSRADFARKRAAWGNSVRIVDFEFAGMNPIGKDDADVFLTIAWQRTADTQVRVTQVAQRWHDERGTWNVISETRKGGDVGLLGEDVPVPAESPDVAIERQARFRTRVIQGD